MFKKTQKMFAIILLMFMIIATTCYATDDTAVVTSETVTTPEESATTDTATNEEITDSTTEDETTDSTVDETLSSEDLHEDDLYQFGDEISVANLVDGNAYLMGRNVTISGKIGGDLFVLADTITLTADSYIYGNLFVCANNIVIDGIVCDLYSISSNLSMSETGIVLRDMRATSSSITLNGSVGRNSHISSDSLTVGETAHIYGDLNYSSKEAIQVPSGSVDGSINYTELSESTNTNVLSYIMNFVYTLIYTLAVLLIMILLAPNFLKKLKDVVSKKSLISFAVGIGVLVLPIPVSILLMLTVIGTPIAFSIIAIWAFLVFGLSFAITAIALGNLIGSKVAILGKAHNLLSIILITLVLWGLLQIPVFLVQFILSTFISIFGLGYLFVTAFLNRKKEEA